MAHTKSARKMIRVSKKRRALNKPIISSVKTRVTKAEKAVAGGEEEAASLNIKAALRDLDKAAQKGIIHPNNAARRKSRLMKKLNSAYRATNP